MLPLSILWHPLAFIIIIIIIYWFLTWSFLVLSIICCSIFYYTIIYATFPPLSFRKRTKNDPRCPCPFCGTFQLRLTRHLRLRHGNEKEVSDALGLPMSRRNEAFAIIRKNGMYKHNVEMMKSTECELLREREQGKPKDLAVCGTCHGYYDKAYMWHHKRHCHPSEDTVSPPSIPVSLMRTSAAVSDHWTYLITLSMTMLAGCAKPTLQFCSLVRACTLWSSRSQTRNWELRAQ